MAAGDPPGDPALDLFLDLIPGSGDLSEGIPDLILGILDLLPGFGDLRSGSAGDPPRDPALDLFLDLILGSGDLSERIPDLILGILDLLLGSARGKQSARQSRRKKIHSGVYKNDTSECNGLSWR